MAHDVFISYAVEDKPTADAVCATLEAERIRCWIAPRDVMPSVSYAEAIVEAISQSRVMVLVFSANSNHSPHVMREVEQTVSTGIPILPFRIEDVSPSPSLKYFIGAVHWLDALTPPLKKHLGHLAETVKLLLSRERPDEEQLEEGPPVEAPSRPTPVRKAFELGVVVRWGRHRVVRLTAVFGVLAAAATILLAGLPFGGGEGGSGTGGDPAGASGGSITWHWTPTPGDGSPTVVPMQPTPAATPLPSPTPLPTSTPGSEGPDVERSPKLLWRFGTGIRGVHSSPAVVDGVVYIGSRDNYVYALDGATGEQLWRFETGDWVPSSPTVVDGVVYIDSNDNYIYALDAATGQKRWRFKMGDSFDSDPAVAGGVVYITGCQGVYALDAATGQELWNVGGWGCVSSSPAVVQGVVYVHASGSVRALDAATGEERWRFSEYLGGTSQPAVVDGILYVGSGDGVVYALDAAAAEELWRVETGEWVEAGLETWRFEPGGGDLSSPVVAEGVVYIGSHDGYVYALDAAAGEQLWRFETGHWVESRPAVVDGVVYFGSQDGYVYAVTEE